MNEKQTKGFGVPNEVDPHHFIVEIPAAKNGDVVITEHYGIKAGVRGNPEIADRCYLPRKAWSCIAEEVKREFNQRLKEKNVAGSRWVVGNNPLERLLGKELLVLAWAVEQADEALIPNAVRNWIGLKPEERWWLYTMTAAATGSPNDAGTGWRKALRYALTENPLSETAPRVARRRSPRKAVAPDDVDQMRLPIVPPESLAQNQEKSI